MNFWFCFVLYASPSVYVHSSLSYRWAQRCLNSCKCSAINIYYFNYEIYFYFYFWFSLEHFNVGIGNETDMYYVLTVFPLYIHFITQTLIPLSECILYTRCSISCKRIGPKLWCKSNKRCDYFFFLFRSQYSSAFLLYKSMHDALNVGI